MSFPERREKGVAGVRLAASAQPPRATSVFTPRIFLLAVATAHSTVFSPPNKRHASGEPRLLRAPARSFLGIALSTP